MDFSQFLPCMFSPVEYNVAKSLGEAAKRNSRHFFLHVQSCCVLCSEKIRRNSTIHGRNSRHFFRCIFRPVFYSVPFCPTGTWTIWWKERRKSTKMEAWEVWERPWEVWDDLPRPVMEKGTPKAVHWHPLTPFLGPHFRHFLSHGLTFFMSAQDLGWKTAAILGVPNFALFFYRFRT